jgi:hypothetical protein
MAGTFSATRGTGRLSLAKETGTVRIDYATDHLELATPNILWPTWLKTTSNCVFSLVTLPRLLY